MELAVTPMQRIHIQNSFKEALVRTVKAHVGESPSWDISKSSIDSTKAGLMRLYTSEDSIRYIKTIHSKFEDCISTLKLLINNLRQAFDKKDIIWYRDQALEYARTMNCIVENGLYEAFSRILNTHANSFNRFRCLEFNIDPNQRLYASSTKASNTVVSSSPKSQSFLRKIQNFVMSYFKG